MGSDLERMPVYWRVWSKEWLLNRNILWLMFLVNAAGTVYGYIWYWEQIKQTWLTHPYWHVLYVPDSPTASLFFTITLVYLLWKKSPQSRVGKALRALVEALAVVTSFKYGIWAVAMIAASGWQGSPITWQHWMLIVSHLGMAAEVLLYARLYTYGKQALAITAIWTLSNDYFDYELHIFPWLQKVLHDDLTVIRWFTVSLSILGLGIAWIFAKFSNSKSV